MNPITLIALGFLGVTAFLIWIMFVITVGALIMNYLIERFS